MKTRQIITDSISILYVMLFVYASVSKILDYEHFQVQLGQSPLLTQLQAIVAWLIPCLEIIISLLLVFNKTRLYGLYAGFTLMVMFSFYIIAITRYSYFIPCSCGGILQHMSWNQHLVFNLFFVVLGSTAILLYNSSLPGTGNTEKDYKMIKTII